jgi:hypothetical protein
MADTDKDLGDALTALRADFRKKISPLRRVEKALDALNARGALDRYDVLEANLPALRDTDLASLGLEEGKAELVARLDEARQRLEGTTRANVLAALGKAAAAEGVEMSRLTDRPLQVLLAPLTVELEVEANKARVLYAREVVEETSLDAADIMKARQAALDRIRDESLESPAFFDLLHRAYRMALVARGEGVGERVDLVDLLAPLALLRVDADRWRSTPPGDMAPYPRHLLAYQLRRLGRDRMLEKDGLRLELGTATGGSTRNKRDVLFVPTGATEGQYHLSIRFVPR